MQEDGSYRCAGGSHAMTKDEAEKVLSSMSTADLERAMEDYRVKHLAPLENT
jgi:hypothetical protein